MSANTTLLNFKDPMKVVRAEPLTSWFGVALGWIVEACTQPLSPEFDIGPAPRSPRFPAFHC